jgi:molybdate transport system permease protein
VDWVAVALTLKLASLTTLILGVVGLPLAYWLATTKRAWRPLVDAAVAVPLLLPPTVLGFYILMSTGPNSAVGRLYGQLFDGTIPFSFAEFWRRR